MGQLAVTEERKEKLIDKLSTQYSLNQISMEEYERLLKYSQDIETDKELSIFEKIIEEHNITETKNDSAQDASMRTQDDYKRMLNKITQEHFTLLSSKKTTGPLTKGSFTAILGEHKIIINEEDLINDKTVIDVMALLGEIVIQVPENVTVINKVFPLLAEVSIEEGLKNISGRKKVVIKGNVILGDVRIKVKRS